MWNVEVKISPEDETLEDLVGDAHPSVPQNQTEIKA